MGVYSFFSEYILSVTPKGHTLFKRVGPVILGYWASDKIQAAPPPLEHRDSGGLGPSFKLQASSLTAVL